MPMIKKIVEGHGGSISVASEVGQGTTITINLPHSESTTSDAATEKQV
jgi:signal transduction histidine kinase